MIGVTILFYLLKPNDYNSACVYFTEMNIAAIVGGVVGGVAGVLLMILISSLLVLAYKYKYGYKHYPCEGKLHLIHSVAFHRLIMSTSNFENVVLVCGSVNVLLYIVPVPVCGSVLNCVHIIPVQKMMLHKGLNYQVRSCIRYFTNLVT